jgi:hypothetical protein
MDVELHEIAARICAVQGLYVYVCPARDSAERQLGEKTSPGLSGLSLTRGVAGGPCLIDTGEKPLDGPAGARIATTMSGTALHVCLGFASPTCVPVNVGENDIPSGRSRGKILKQAMMGCWVCAIRFIMPQRRCSASTEARKAGT